MSHSENPEGLFNRRLSRRKFVAHVGGFVLGAAGSMFIHQIPQGVAEVRAGGDDARAVPDFDPIRPYIAGGEFADPTLYSPRLFRHEGTTSTLVLSPSVLDETAGNLQTLESRVSPVSHLLGPDTTAFLQADGVVIFKEDPGRKFTVWGTTIVTVFNSETGESYEVTTPYPRLQPRWHDEYGLVATLYGYTLTDEFDIAANTWREFDKPQPIGTAHQRMVENLRDLQSASKGNGVLLPLGLEAAEIDIYDRGGNPQGYNSFRIWTRRNGEPGLLIATGGEFGLSTNLGNIDSSLQALNRLEDLAPGVVDDLILQGLRAISTYFNSGQSGLAFYADFDNKRGIVQLNERGFAIFRAPEDLIATFLQEGRGIGTLNSQSRAIERLHLNPGVDKGLFALSFLDKYYSMLTPLERERISLSADDTVNRYQKNPALANLLTKPPFYNRTA